MQDARYSVLLLDDEPHIIDVLSMVVDWERYGFTVTGTSSNAYDALSQIAARRFDLIVTDINLPQIDGLAFIERVRKTDPQVEIMIISGHNRFEYAQRAIQYHVDSYILKPIDPREVGDQLLGIRRRLNSSYGQESAENQDAEYGDISEIIAYIRQNYRTSISLKSLSEHFFINASYLGQKFKVITGESFNDYLNKLRIAYVKGYGRVKFSRMNEVIRNAGYVNPQYFYTQFKRFEHISFAEYIKSKSGNDH